jgi:hypothetical protein
MIRYVVAMRYGREYDMAFIHEPCRNLVGNPMRQIRVEGVRDGKVRFLP